MLCMLSFRRGTMAALLLGVLLAAEFSQAQSASAAADQLKPLVDRFTAAQVNFDAATLRDLTTPDYVEVSPVGDVDPRDKMLGFYSPEAKAQAPSATASVSEYSIRVFDKTAVVIAKVTFQMKGPDGKERTSYMRDTFICRQTDHGWKLFSVQ